MLGMRSAAGLFSGNANSNKKAVRMDDAENDFRSMHTFPFGIDTIEQLHYGTCGDSIMAMGCQPSFAQRLEHEQS